MTELTKLKGIGEKTAGALSRLGISCVEELLRYIPRDYEEFEAPKAIYELRPGRTEAVDCILRSDASVNRYNGMTIVNVNISDMAGRLQISWYNMPYIRQNLRAGAHYVFRGRVYEKNGRLIMGQPKLYRPEDFEKGYQGRLMPLYHLSSGISNKTVMKAVAEALGSEAMNSAGAEFLPEELRRKNGLMDESESIKRVHFPGSRKELSEARRRLCFDELLLFFLLQKKRKQLFTDKTSEYRCRPELRFLKMTADLPFELTTAQAEAVKTISRDMSSGRVMNRLLEGDVGSGKTIVAFLAMAYAAFCGYQAAMMVPTEVLAKQHYEKLLALIERQELPLRPVLLCGSMTASEKERIYGLIRSHEADIVIGTHALFQEKVEYDSLGLVVTDEQHRFGVSQREAMKQKGGLPHMLFMSATPIPRTLSMILYGDMDVSVIDKLPEGRLPIKNTVVGPGYRRNAYKFIYDEIKKKHRAYIVCPAIDAGDEDTGEGGSGERTGSKLIREGAASGGFAGAQELENVEDYAAKLGRIFPKEVRIGKLHGRMKSQEKEQVMQDFKDGRLDILVSTTVIEVGVDVPEATVMMIENAERFGLSQLHQLRGRVGRGQAQSYCIMINTSDKEEAAERLGIIRDSNDGFFIASEDLRLRGPGDLFGVRQSGEMGFEIADIYRDQALLGPAGDAAEEILASDPDIKAPGHEGLAKKLSLYMEKSYYV